MKRIFPFFFIILFCGMSSFAQKMNGYGAELSILSFKPNARFWISRNTGFEIFGGIASEVDDFNPNDVEAGFKFLHTIMYNRTDRTYLGFVGKWKWANINDANNNTNLPIGGLFIGKEWYNRRINRKGIAIELGYQIGSKNYEIFSPLNHTPLGKDSFNEFPLILNLRYSFYQKR